MKFALQIRGFSTLKANLPENVIKLSFILTNDIDFGIKIAELYIRN